MLFGVGTPRSLQGRVALIAIVAALCVFIDGRITALWPQHRDYAIRTSIVRIYGRRVGRLKIMTCATGCQARS
jgi:hypothetical protein